MALTDDEMQSLLKIQSLFGGKKKKQDRQIISAKVDESPVEKEGESHPVKLKELIEEANKDLSEQEKLLQQNGDYLRQIEVNKAVVVASTRDFQETCMVILNREYVLTCVVREIEKHQQHYKNQEECTLILNHEKTIEQPSELEKVLVKI